MATWYLHYSSNVVAFVTVGDPCPALNPLQCRQVIEVVGNLRQTDNVKCLKSWRHSRSVTGASTNF